MEQRREGKFDLNDVVYPKRGMYVGDPGRVVDVKKGSHFRYTVEFDGGVRRGFHSGELVMVEEAQSVRARSEEAARAIIGKRRKHGTGKKAEI